MKKCSIGAMRECGRRERLRGGTDRREALQGEERARGKLGKVGGW